MSVIIPKNMNKWKVIGEYLKNNPFIKSRYNRKKFFEDYKQKFGDIKSQKTVDTINAILDRASKEKTPDSHLAYMFATAYHESKDAKNPHDFYPLTERGSYKYITDQYWHNIRVRGWLGNKSIKDAWDFRGRGLVQLTGRTNYERFNIADNPEKALEPEKAVEIMFEGMKKGMFTGKDLDDYLNGNKDYYNARRIINGVDKASLIKGYAERFEKIIKNAR